VALAGGLICTIHHTPCISYTIHHTPCASYSIIHHSPFTPSYTFIAGAGTINRLYYTNILFFTCRCWHGYHDYCCRRITSV
jgi:hypothetical protein